MGAASWVGVWAGGGVSNANTRNWNPFPLAKHGDMWDQEVPPEKSHSWTDEGGAQTCTPKTGARVSYRQLVGQMVGGGQGLMFCVKLILKH